MPANVRNEAEKLLASLKPIHRPLPVWTPNPGPQTEAYNSTADIVLYGGAAGAGKSALLLGLAATKHQRSIVYRREYRSLRELEEQLIKLVGNRGEYNYGSTTMRLAHGRFVEFGAMANLGDEQAFQGRPHDLICFDEVTQFAESQVRFVMGWRRTTDPKQRTRVVMATNPPTSAEGEWVTRWFAPWLDIQHPNPAAPGELRWFTTIAGQDVEVPSGDPITLENGEVIQPVSRTVIRAHLDDNPFLRDTDYRATLQAMPEPLRSKLLYGDWNAGREDPEQQVIPTAWVLAAQERWKNAPKPTGPMSTVGVDVARGGKDQTVLTPRWDNYFGQQVCKDGSSTPDGPAVTHAVLMAMRGSPCLNVDTVGVGASVYDDLRARGLPVVSLVGSAKAPGKDRTGQMTFRNMRAWLWWRMREALDPVEGDDLCLPPDRQLLADLTAPRWKTTVGGILIESKEDLQKRIGRSPDRGDSAVYALFQAAPQMTDRELRKLKTMIFRR